VTLTPSVPLFETPADGPGPTPTTFIFWVKDTGAAPVRWLYPREATAKSQVIMMLRKGLVLVWGLLKNTGRNFFQDNGFFLAMGLAYNLLLYFIPLTLLMISALGYTISIRNGP